MNRRAIATLVLAGLVILGTSGASGGCGGSGGDDRGVSAPHVGGGGEQSAPSEEHSSEEKTPNPSHDAQPRKSPSDKPSEETGGDHGHDPCVAVFAGDGDRAITVGRTLSAKVTIANCTSKPKQYSGVLTLAYTPDNPPGTWVPEATQPVYSPSGTTEIKAPCKNGWWVQAYVASGRDAKDDGFRRTYSSLPKDVECP
jgi:hypothetical protein